MTNRFAALKYMQTHLGGAADCQSLDLLADPDESGDLFGMLLRVKSKL